MTNADHAVCVANLRLDKPHVVGNKADHDGETGGCICCQGWCLAEWMLLVVTVAVPTFWPDVAGASG